MPGSCSFFGEFGVECLNAIPYAYYLHKQEKLKSTTSVAGMSPFYYFSKNHRELQRDRWYVHNFAQTPINVINSHEFDERYWLAPPYKKVYSNSTFRFSKPVLMICNKYNSEWEHAPVNFLSLEMIEFIIENLSHKYQIIYNRYCAKNDTSIVLPFGDFEFLKRRYPDVILMQDLQSKTGMNFNELQLKVYANCENFISVQGGNSVLASYFGGINCIYARKGLELKYDEFSRNYTRLSGAEIRNVTFESSDIIYEGTPSFNVSKIRRNIDEEFKELISTSF